MDVPLSQSTKILLLSCTLEIDAPSLASKAPHTDLNELSRESRKETRMATRLFPTKTALTCAGTSAIVEEYPQFVKLFPWSLQSSCGFQTFSDAHLSFTHTFSMNQLPGSWCLVLNSSRFMPSRSPLKSY